MKYGYLAAIKGIRSCLIMSCAIFLLISFAIARADTQAEPFLPACPPHLVEPKEAKKSQSPVRSGILQLQSHGERIALADPVIERASTGQIRVYGTSSDEFLEYRNEQAFLAGASPERKKIEFLHPNGKRLNPDEMPWDLIPVPCPTDRGPASAPQPYMAGVMTPKEGEIHAKWPEDNQGRRTYAFVPDAGNPYRLVRSDKPVLRDKNPRDWIGHNYGRDFVRDENGNAIMNPDGTLTIVYERVTRKTKSGKLVTELASRRIKCPTLETGEEKILMKIDDKKPRAAVRREDGGLLMEGPRVQKMSSQGRDVFVMGFSSGDFPTDRYGINLAYSVKPEGPYQPVLSPDGRDLKDFGQELREEYGLSWGPARPAFFRDSSGQMWLAFHAVEKADHPGVDFSKWPKDLEPFQRRIFMTPFQMKIGKDGKPEFEISNFKCGSETSRSAKPNAPNSGSGVNGSKALR